MTVGPLGTLPAVHTVWPRAGASYVLAAFLASGLALAVLMVGQFVPDPRTLAAGVPLNMLMLPAAALFALSLPIQTRSRGRVLLVAACVVPAALTLLWSADAERGATTLLNLGLSGLVSALLLVFSFERVGMERSFQVWIALLFSLLVAAVAYKMVNGLLDRNVNFLMNGPNVFARQMGLAALLSGFFLRGAARWLAIAAFSLAVVWTQSKGPLLALLVVGVAVSWRGLGYRGRVTVLLLIGLALGAILAFAEELRDVALLRRFFVAAAVFDAGADGENYGSLGSRIDLFSVALQILAERPFGIGFGSWMLVSGTWWAEYPHNFFLEALVEGGLLFGSIMVAGFFSFIRSSCVPVVSACAFLALCQQVSGGLADARFWLAFACLGAATTFSRRVSPAFS